ncbi:hypothetical protein K474DRAFT_1605722 [Panus rudis PR-1116 ss-1]|nr:hypothetical protein K474DRAFT_1605722 [Panus rudis PR-1116 ss-1]
MLLDLRTNPVTTHFRALSRALNSWDLTRFACEPPLRFIQLSSPYYPWTIECTSTNPVGVTLYELFGAIWENMQTPIGSADYWNCEMNEVTRERVAVAYRVRCADDEDEVRRGVRRVDFLMDRVWLVGFGRGRDANVWEMKIKRAPGAKS